MAFKLRSGFLKTGGFKKMGASSPNKKTYAEAKAADPKLDSYIKQRGDHEAGSEAYEKLQAKINAAYGKTRDTKALARDKAAAEKKTGDVSKALGEAVTVAAGGAAGKALGGAGVKGVEKNVKVSDDGKKVTEQYTKKSAADAPGKAGVQTTSSSTVKAGDYATPASETKAGKAAAERAATAEKRAGQTKRQAIRDAKKSADYKTTDRQERKNIRDEAAAMSGGSRRDVRKARKAEKAAKGSEKTNKTVTVANKPEEFKKSNDPKTPMAKKKI